MSTCRCLTQRPLPHEGHCCLDDGREGGYYTAGRDIINRLDARAERIERGES